jgi:lipoate-protein ligase A
MSCWRYLTDDGAGAAAGLALDEALMSGVGRGADAATPALRMNCYADHAALVGSYKTLAAELDLEACARTGTAVSRRATGGGAIIMGSGQLGVALVLPAPATAPKLLLPELAAGIVDGLGFLGIRAEFGGKNDLLVNGRKIAGLGLYLDQHGALLFHSSILLDLDTEFMLQVLRIPATKLAGKAAGAVRERVTTVRRELDRTLGLDTLREAIAAGFSSRHGVRLIADSPNADELAAAAGLVTSRYAAHEWLHETNAAPDGTGSAAFRSPEGMVRVFVAAQGRLIKSVLFTGDFSVLPAGLRELEAALRWQRLDSAVLTPVARGVAERLGDDLGWTRESDVVEAVLAAGARALEREQAAPHRPHGSCYFPDRGEGLDLAGAVGTTSSRSVE